MALKTPKHVTIIGVGLLGGSAGLAIKAHDPRIRVAGVGRRIESLEAALKAGAIDTAHLTCQEPVAQSDLVILATPVGAFSRHMRAIAPVLRPGAVVTDVGSTKARVVAAAARVFGPGGPFVGSHPMAGSEQKGVPFARADLFHGATCILTPTPHTPPALVARVEAFWRLLGMHTVRMAPGDHDRTVARVSHLPHALAALLMLLPADADLAVSASGFRDATRLAGGDPEMWRDIFTTNRPAVLAALKAFANSLDRFADLLARDDAKALERLLTLAKRRRETTILAALADRRIAAE
ncbi:MAG: prephenate dehydrogenase [Planctomycetota bacterium]|nr:prephenate dehydrogenase [Planctomycetota bacterium]